MTCSITVSGAAPGCDEGAKTDHINRPGPGPDSAPTHLLAVLTVTLKAAAAAFSVSPFDYVLNQNLSTAET